MKTSTKKSKKSMQEKVYEGFERRKKLTRNEALKRIEERNNMSSASSQEDDYDDEEDD